MPLVPLGALNGLDAAAFTARLGAIFEHSPWVAARAWAQRPFTSLAALRDAMVGVVEAASEDEKLALLRAHPELGAKGLLAKFSADEQAGAGLDALDAERQRRLDLGNAAYRERFGFPFIVAVREHDRDSVIVALERRLANDADVERATALREVAKIAGHRLAALISNDL